MADTLFYMALVIAFVIAFWLIRDAFNRIEILKRDLDNPWTHAQLREIASRLEGTSMDGGRIASMVTGVTLTRQESILLAIDLSERENLVPDPASHKWRRTLPSYTTR